MISRSTLLHLRIPFSFYLMPVFFFAASRNIYRDEFLPSYPGTNIYYELFFFGKYWLQAILVFISIHLFLYPASNAFNSYYDKDEKAIGGLENPPPVSKELLYVSLIFDLIAILIGLAVNWEFALMLFIYGLVSKAYSHPVIRLKKYGVIAWLTAGVFQGGFTFLMVVIGLQGYGLHLHLFEPFIWPMIISTIMILGFYPLTQVYQHEEDALHGDNTISRQLGIKGTFRLSLFMFLLADFGFYGLYYGNLFGIDWFWVLQLFLSPVFIYFLWWFYRSSKDAGAANYRNTMRMNKIASSCLVVFFILYGMSLWWLIYTSRPTFPI